MLTADFILGIVSFTLTLAILSYIITGDNPVFRIATYLFIGVSAGYVVLVVVTQVIIPELFLPIISGHQNGQQMSLQAQILMMVPLLLSLLLFAKLSPDTAPLGNISMAYLVGVSAAVTIGGVMMGTLVSQSLATINLFPRIDQIFSSGGASAFVYALFTLIGALATLFFFYFGAKSRSKQAAQSNRRAQILEYTAQVGQVFIAITFGAIFAGVYISALSALVERINFLIHFVI